MSSYICAEDPPIYIRDTDRKYGALSPNSSWWTSSRGTVFPSVTHAACADVALLARHRYDVPYMYDAIKNATSPIGARILLRSLLEKLNREEFHNISMDWEFSGIYYLEEAVHLRFLNHPHLLRLLETTGSTRIVYEPSYLDSFPLFGTAWRGTTFASILEGYRGEAEELHRTILRAASRKAAKRR